MSPPSEQETVQSKADDAFNLLLVPFPYRISATCFKPGPICHPNPAGPTGERLPTWRFFDVEQKWLESEGKPLAASEIADFLEELIRRARLESDEVHGVVLPEIALTKELADQVADEMAKRKTGIEVLITGVTKRDKRGGSPEKPAEQVTNGVWTYLFRNTYKMPARTDGTDAADGAKCESGRRTKRELESTERVSDWFQSKHHRWKLEKSQINRYNLGAQLNPEYFWWERSNIHDRSCTFYFCRPGMSIAALVCEDLARIDPVQTVIRSVGPTLVVALLMDGPQAESRWSGRYATVLADDPGSAVLTLTSLALLERSATHDKPNKRQIGLWKGAEGVTREIVLPDKKHAVLVTLSRSSEVNSTIDGRLDDGATYKLSMTAVIPVAHPNPPRWLGI
jgi:hypothetical protein